MPGSRLLLLVQPRLAKTSQEPYAKFAKRAASMRRGGLLSTKEAAYVAIYSSQKSMKDGMNGRTALVGVPIRFALQDIGVTEGLRVLCRLPVK